MTKTLHPLRLLALLACFIAPQLLHAQSATVTWTSVPLSLGAGYGHFTSVAFGGGTFVAVASVPFADRNLPNTLVRLATSPDGTTWTARSIDTGLNSPLPGQVRYLNGRFTLFVFGTRTTGFATNVYTSTDGSTWTASDTSSAIQSIPVETDYGNGRYVAAGLFGSADGTAWSGLASPITGIFSYLDVAYGNGRWFATTNGAGGTITSTDGVNWTAVPFFAQLGGYRVEWCNGFWFFYSQGNNAVSTDGVTFTSLTRSNITPGGTATIRFANGRLVAPGPLYFQSSTDGRNWTSMGNYPAPPANATAFITMNEAAYGAGKYVYVGGQFQVSPLIYTLNEADVPSAPVPPAITAAPVATAAVLGGPATFSVAASGSGNTYQWLKDNTAIAGATAATYTIAAVTAASAGNYSVRIANSLGTVASTPVALTLVAASAAGRLVNMSIRTGAGTGDNTLIVGLGLGGAGTAGNKAVLLRAVGPTLAAFGVGGALADPVMTVFQGSTQVDSNDDWNATAGATFAGLGAFAFSAGSRDSAIYGPSIPSGSYSIQITGKAGATGIALAEIYDATASSAFGTATPRLVNVSARTQVGTGDNLLIAGFVIGGSTPVRVLIRAVGPTLSAFGVGGALADPKLDVFSGSAVVASNDNWDAATAANFARVGAFALSAGSRDAALVATLQPGSYTAQVSGANNTSGVALVEVYELP